MQFKSTAALWLAVISLTSMAGLSFGEDLKKADAKCSSCKVSCKGGSCDAKCEIECVIAPSCGAVNCLDLLGKLAGLEIAVEVAEACCCSDACKCADACKCSKKARCQPTCKCKSTKAKGAENIWGEKQFVATKCNASKSGVCAKKGCCDKANAIAKKKQYAYTKKLAATPRPPIAIFHAPYAQAPHHHQPPTHAFHGHQIPRPYAVPYAHQATAPQPQAASHGCPQQGTHAWQLHEHLVKITAENAQLKATNEVQQQLYAQQLQHQKQMVEAQVQIVRLQAQVELVSRQEEIRDQLVEATLQAAQAEWLLEVAAESPEAFVKMVKGESAAACSGRDCEVHAIKAENNVLRAKVAQLERQIQEVIKHTAQRQPVIQYGQPAQSYPGNPR